MAHLKTLLVIGGASFAIAALPAPVQACGKPCSSSSTSSSTSSSSGGSSSTGSTGGSSSTGSTGGTDVPAPAALALFGLGAGVLMAKRRRVRA